MGDEKRNPLEANLDEGFKAVRTEATKVLEVISANRETVNNSFDKVLAETKCT